MRVIVVAAEHDRIAGELARLLNEAERAGLIVTGDPSRGRVWLSVNDKATGRQLAGVEYLADRATPGWAPVMYT